MAEAGRPPLTPSPAQSRRRFCPDSREQLKDERYILYVGTKTIVSTMVSLARTKIHYSSGRWREADVPFQERLVFDFVACPSVWIRCCVINKSPLSEQCDSPANIVVVRSSTSGSWGRSGIASGHRRRWRWWTPAPCLFYAAAPKKAGAEGADVLDVEGHERSTATLDRRVHSRRLPRRWSRSCRQKYRVQIIVDGDRVICDIWSSDGKQEWTACNTSAPAHHHRRDPGEGGPLRRPSNHQHRLRRVRAERHAQHPVRPPRSQDPPRVRLDPQRQAEGGCVPGVHRRDQKTRKYKPPQEHIDRATAIPEAVAAEFGIADPTTSWATCGDKTPDDDRRESGVLRPLPRRVQAHGQVRCVQDHGHQQVHDRGSPAEVQ